MPDVFISISAFLNVISGLALLIYWYAYAVFLPYGQLSTTLSILVKNRNWQWINALGVLGALAGLLGQAGIYIIQLPNSNWFAGIVYYVAALGTALLVGTMLWDTILWPILVKHDASLLDFQGPIYSSKTFLPFFIASGLIYSAGFILVGIGIVQLNILPVAAGYLIAIGAPLFGLGAMFGKFQIYPRSVGVTLMAVGLIWLGLAMVS
jgi:voltage-gated potassium channel Kch